MDLGVAGGATFADYLPSGVHCTGKPLDSSERAEVGHPARLCPGKGMRISITDREAFADHLTGVIHRTGKAEGPSESAEIDHPTRSRPGEGVARGLTRSAHCAPGWLHG
jgi:hypothetical protein